jgi:DHA1 family multidrug resistance protein-like MFS transporter
MSATPLSAGATPPAGGGNNPTDPTEIRGHPRTAVRIAVIHGSATLADFMWYPFLPLLAVDLAGGDQALALYWVSASWIVMGALRVFAGPVWGYLSDHVGRKPMLVRSQISAMAAPVLTVWMDAPWQLCIVMGMVGLFSANMMAAVSLTSVVVPPAKLSRSLALVSGAQYIGMTVGPALGALVMTQGGYTLAAFVSALLCGLAALSSLFLIPADLVRARGVRAPALEPLRPSAQLWLILVIQMTLFAITYLMTIVSPVVLKALDPAQATQLTGLAFTLAGLGSAAGILFLSARMARPGRLGPALVVCCLGGGLSLFLIAAGSSVSTYIAGFTVASLLLATMTPAVNSLTALNVPVARRGTAFGLVSSAQAAAFVIGPSAAALFAATSYPAGFAGVGVAFLALALLIWRGLREPAA